MRSLYVLNCELTKIIPLYRSSSPNCDWRAHRSADAWALSDFTERVTSGNVVGLYVLVLDALPGKADRGASVTFSSSAIP